MKNPLESKLTVLLHANRLILALGMAMIIATQPAIVLAQGVHGIAMHGKPKYSAGFKHFDYVNPNAPKRGVLKQSSRSKFDSLNPYIAKGVSAEGIGLIYDTLMTASADEAFTQYGLIAESIEIPKDRSWVRYHLNPKAQFHDGAPITANDVKFSFDLLIEKGKPLYQFYYADVKSVIVEDKLTVKFEFKNAKNRELALIVGQLPILPKHFWKNRDFASGALEMPLGSSAYRIKSFDAGKRIQYELVTDYWAKDLPVNKGRNNFKEIVYTVFLDDTVALEAFKSGNLNFRVENTAKQWATQYQGKKFESGELVKQTIPHSQSAGMQGFVFNTRRAIFQDKVLREAMAYAFDFEWSNKNLFYDQYTRTKSYFANTELASAGLPSEAELELLHPFKAQLPNKVFTEAYEPPSTNGSGRARKNLRLAKQLLKEAGYVIKKGKLISPKTKAIVTFEMLLFQPAFERVVLPFKKNLSALGIDMSVRKVDVTQYVERLRSTEFDMTVSSFGQSLSPGNEQREYWSSAAADRADSRNIIGIKDPVIDALIESLIVSPNREALVTRTRALDRVLLWGHYVIPNWHVAVHRVAHSGTLSHPETFAKYQLDWLSWWQN